MGLKGSDINIARNDGIVSFGTIVAFALFLSPGPRELTFLSLDAPQRAVARRLGFNV